MDAGGSCTLPFQALRVGGMLSSPADGKGPPALSLATPFHANLSASKGLSPLLGAAVNVYVDAVNAVADAIA